MASIKDALEETIIDNLSIVKFFILALPVFSCYVLFNIGNMGLFCIFGLFTFIILLNLLIQTLHNVRNGKNYVLPTFNIFTFGITAFKAVFAVGPLVAAGIIGGKFLTELRIPIPVPNIQLIYSIIVWLLIGSILVTSLILYSKTQKIKDAYNFKMISDICIDMLLAIIFYILQLLIIDGIFLGVIGYLFAIFFNLGNPVFIYLCCMTFVWDIAVMGHYFAQLDYEIVPRDEEIKPGTLEAKASDEAS